MLRRIKITGHSLTPEFREGDFVITSKIPLFFNCLKAGDIVVFEQAPYGKMIKRVQWVDYVSRMVFVVGDHPNSTDSRHFGPIAMNQLIGKVIWHIPKPAR